jgi:hypothetical protein
LLATRDADHFAAEVVASVQDWRDLRVNSVSTPLKTDHPLDLDLNQPVQRQRGAVVKSAILFLKEARQLRLDPGQVQFKIQRKLDRAKIYSTSRALTDKHDPALTKLGKTFVHLLSSHDTRSFTTEFVLRLGKLKGAFAGYSDLLVRPFAPSAAETEMSGKEFHRRWTDSVENLLARLGRIGVDLSMAEVRFQGAVVRGPTVVSWPVFGSLEGIESGEAEFTFRVQADRKATSGQAISGDYKVAVGQLTREGNNWLVSDCIYWKSFPKGMLDEKERAA